MRTIWATSAPKAGSAEAKSGMAIGRGVEIAARDRDLQLGQNGARGQHRGTGQTKLEGGSAGQNGHLVLVSMTREP